MLVRASRGFMVGERRTKAVRKQAERLFDFAASQNWRAAAILGHEPWKNRANGRIGTNDDAWRISLLFRFYLYLFQALCFYIDDRNFVRYFSCIKDTWISTIEFLIEIHGYVIFSPLIRVFESCFSSVLNAQASFLDRCCGILNVSTLYKFHDTGGRWKKKRNRPFDVCAQPKFFLFLWYENIPYISVPWLSSNTHKQF